MQKRKLNQTCLSLFALTAFFCGYVNTADAQSFREKNNPLKNLHVASGRVSEPCLVDINKDGNADVFSGEFNYKTGGVTNSVISFYKNTGSINAPVFKLADANENPLSNVAIPGLIIPKFVDIDGDGDEDCFIAGNNGSITFMLNTGTATNAVFEKQSAAFNALSMVKLQGLEISNFVFADIDNDKDFDCVITDEAGEVSFFKNNGSATKPLFEYVAAKDAPFVFLKNTDVQNISFFDWNKDGFTDMFVNNIFYQNNADKAHTAFIENRLNTPVICNSEMLSPNWISAGSKTVIVSGNRQGGFNYLTTADATAKTLLTVSAYPNPSTKGFMLDLSKTGGEKVIKVTDAKGNLISLYKTNNAAIKVGENLQPGIYFIQLMQDDTITASQKIVKM